MNEACIWQYIFLGEGGGVKNLGKSDYVVNECS